MYVSGYSCDINTHWNFTFPFLSVSGGTKKMPSLGPWAQCGATDLGGWWQDSHENNRSALATRTCRTCGTCGAPSVSDWPPAQAAVPEWACNWASAEGSLLSSSQKLAGLLSPGAEMVFLESWRLNSFFDMKAPGVNKSREDLYKERLINTSLFYHHWKRV